MNTDQGIELGEQAVKEFRLHVQVGCHPLTEHLLDDLEQLTVMLLRDYELVDVLLSLGLVSLKS